jgi:hypothetical protein
MAKKTMKNIISNRSWRGSKDIKKNNNREVAKNY